MGLITLCEVFCYFYLSHKMGNKNTKVENESKPSTHKNQDNVTCNKTKKEESYEFPGPWKNEIMLFDTNIKAKRIIEVKGNVLDLKAASLYVTPPSLCSRIELIELDLSLNPIKQHFTDEMTKLTNLQTLIIKECYFHSIPIPMMKMISLRKLDLSNNNISSSYSELRTLTNLEELYLNACGLNNFKNINTLVNLKVLELSHNFIYGSISSIGYMISLERLIIANSGLTSFELHSNKLKNLKYLDLFRNNLSIFDEIRNIPSLQILLIDRIRVEDSFDGLENLEELHIRDIDWYCISESLCNLSKLRFLKMKGKLGVLNDYLYLLQNLQEIELQSTLVMSKYDMIGCTILKLTNDTFDIKSLFPHISDDIIENIKIKETANITPDFSCLQSLKKVSYLFEGHNNSMEIHKEDEKWIVDSKIYPYKSIEIEYKFKPLGPDVIYVGRNGIFVIIPQSMFKYSQESEEKVEKIDIVEFDSYTGSIYTRDTTNRIWKCRYHHAEVLELFTENIVCFSKVVARGSNHSFFGIHSDGILYDLGMQESTKICENIFKVFGNNVFSLCVNENGQLVEIYNIGTPNQKILHIEDIPNIQGGIVSEVCGVTSEGFNTAVLPAPMAPIKGIRRSCTG